MLPKIDLLVVQGTVGAVGAKKVAGDMPTVFVGVGAPVEIGIVQSLAHPGGNMTGVTFEAAAETYGKRLQLLKEIVPDLKRVAVLRAVGDPNVQFAMTSLDAAAPELRITLVPIDLKSADDATEVALLVNSNFSGIERQTREMGEAARTRGLRFSILKAGTEREIDAAFATLGQLHAEALLVGSDPFLTSRREHFTLLPALIA